MTQLLDLDPIVAGDDVSFDLRFIDVNGDPLNVAGDVLYVTFKSDISESDGNADMQVIYNVPDDAYTQVGVVTVPITKTDTNIAAGTYNYDFQWVKSASGEVVTEYLGKVKVLKGVTLT